MKNPFRHISDWMEVEDSIEKEVRVDRLIKNRTAARLTIAGIVCFFGVDLAGDVYDFGKAVITGEPTEIVIGEPQPVIDSINFAFHLVDIGASAALGGLALGEMSRINGINSRRLETVLEENENNGYQAAG